MKNPAAHYGYLLQTQLVLLAVGSSLSTTGEWAVYDQRCGHTPVT